MDDIIKEYKQLYDRKKIDRVCTNELKPKQNQDVLCALTLIK